MLRDGTLPLDEKQSLAMNRRVRCHIDGAFFPFGVADCPLFICGKEAFLAMKRLSTRNMVYLSILISLNIVLTRVASIRIGVGGAEIVRIGFGGFPIIFAGITMGPMAGGIVGAIGDIIGYNINPMGAYMPHFTLSAALTGIIPGLVLKPFKKEKETYTFWQLLLAIAIGQITTSIFMVPYFMQLLFKVPMVSTVPGRVIGQAIHVPLYAFMTAVIMKRIPSTFEQTS